MPLATVSRETIGPLYLETLDGAWIKVRKMGYGKHLKRQEIAARVSQAMPENNNKGGKKGEDRRLDYTMMAEDSQVFVFRECLVDHNLEDENGHQLQLGTRMGIDQLDPMIGQEIDKLIDMVNENEDIEEYKNRRDAGPSAPETNPSEMGVGSGDLHTVS